MSAHTHTHTHKDTKMCVCVNLHYIYINKPLGGSANHHHHDSKSQHNMFWICNAWNGMQERSSEMQIVSQEYQSHTLGPTY